MLARDLGIQLMLGGLLATGAAAQPGTDSSVSGPGLGFASDNAHATLRPILGLPGAAVLGTSTALPDGTGRVFLAPMSRWALVQNAARTQWSVLTNLSAASPAAAPLDGLFPDTDLVYFSADGGAAALYSAARQSVQLAHGFPDAPVISRTIDLTRVPGLVTAAAVSADGNLLLLGISTDSGAWLLLSDSDTTAPRQITTNAGAITALAWSGADALFADSARNQIVLLQDAANSAQVQVLATDADGVASPVAVAAGDDRYYAAMAGGRVLGIPRRASDTLQTLDCACSITALTSMPGAAKYLRLNDSADGQPIWILDPTAGQLFFVPATVAAGEGNSAQ